MFIKNILLIPFLAMIVSCSCFSTTPDPALKKRSVAEVSAQLQASPAKLVVLDANPDSVRASKGTLPGAIKLTGYDSYALSELPADKSAALVFYCYNEGCGASTAAANRAITAGYKNVSVMEAGIEGWNATQKK